MKRRRKSATRVKSTTPPISVFFEYLCLPNLEAFVEKGEITPSMLEPIDDVAIASGDHGHWAC
jgi:hypothetical protein